MYGNLPRTYEEHSQIKRINNGKNKSGQADSWMEKMSTYSGNTSSQIHKERVPYNKYLTQLSGERPKMMRKIVKKYNNLSIQPCEEELQKIKQYQVESSEYNRTFQQKTLPLLYEQQNQSQPFDKQESSIMDEQKRVKEAFDGLIDNQEFPNGEINNGQADVESGVPASPVKEKNGQQNEIEKQKELSQDDKVNQSQEDIQSSALFDRQSTQSQLEGFMEMNQEYFDHLRGKCACVQDQCGTCFCKYQKVKLKPDLRLLKQVSSIYGKDFAKKKDVSYNSEEIGGIDVIQRMNSNGNFKLENIALQTIQQRDYTTPKYNNDRYQPIKKQYSYNNMPTGRTSYNTQFFDYVKVPFELVKCSTQKTTLDNLPFFSDTTYRQHFKTQPGQDLRRKPVGNSWDVSLVKSPVPFLSQTSTKEFYKPYKLKDKVQKLKQPCELEIQDNGIYSGQFDSRYQRDYQKTLTKSCEIKKVQQQKFMGSQYVPINQNVMRRSCEINGKRIEQSSQQKQF